MWHTVAIAPAKLKVKVMLQKSCGKTGKPILWEPEIKTKTKRKKQL